MKPVNAALRVLQVRATVKSHVPCTLLICLASIRYPCPGTRRLHDSGIPPPESWFPPLCRGHFNLRNSRRRLLDCFRTRERASHRP